MNNNVSNDGDQYDAPKFEPSGVVSPSEFSAVDDDDVPF